MTLENTSLTTVTYFRFEGWNHQLWAMSQMQLALSALKQVPGLSFFKLLGTGRRFHYLPNFSVYGILGVWEAIEDAQAFRNTPIFQRFTAHSKESWTVYLKNYQAHGYWSGKQPFVFYYCRATASGRTHRGAYPGHHQPGATSIVLEASVAHQPSICPASRLS